MTHACKELHVSKLELFTPNFFIDFPPLTFGTYFALGTNTTMILKSDVLARKQHIINLLTSTGSPTDEAHLKKRVANHERIMQAFDLTFYDGKWCTKGTMVDDPELDDRRKRFAAEQARRELLALGVKRGQYRGEGDEDAEYWRGMSNRMCRKH